MKPRTWAIESTGIGYLLALLLIAAGQSVVNVAATFASQGAPSLGV